MSANSTTSNKGHILIRQAADCWGDNFRGTSAQLAALRQDPRHRNRGRWTGGGGRRTPLMDALLRLRKAESGSVMAGALPVAVTQSPALPVHHGTQYWCLTGILGGLAIVIILWAVRIAVEIVLLEQKARRERAEEKRRAAHRLITHKSKEAK